MSNDRKESLKRLGYDYENMSKQDLKKRCINNTELVYTSLQANKTGMSYGQYVASMSTVVVHRPIKILKSTEDNSEYIVYKYSKDSSITKDDLPSAYISSDNNYEYGIGYLVDGKDLYLDSSDVNKNDCIRVQYIHITKKNKQFRFMEV